MGVRHWHFIERADGDLVRVPRERFNDFWFRSAILPPTAPGLIHAAFIGVEMERYRVRAFLVGWFFRYPLRADGTLDKQPILDGWRKAAEAGDRFTADGAINLAAYRAERQVDRDQSWRPGHGTLSALAEIINRRADSPVVRVGHAELE